MPETNGKIRSLEEDCRFQEYVVKYESYAASRLAERIYLESNGPSREWLMEIRLKEISGISVRPAYIIGRGRGMHQLKEFEGIFFVPQWSEGKNKNTLDVKFIPAENIIDIR